MILLRQLVLISVLLLLGCSQTIAGPVIVRDSSDKAEVDAFAIRDQLLKQHEWQEQIRLQQQLTILAMLPVGCQAILWPYKYFACGANYYRPYRYQQQDLYIQIPEPPAPER